MNIEPLHDRVLVERIPDPEGPLCPDCKKPMRASGPPNLWNCNDCYVEMEIPRIIIPEVARDVAVKCKVIAVGPGRWEDGVFTKTAVKPGDVVLVPGCGNTYPDWQAGQQILIQTGDIGAILG